PLAGRFRSWWPVGASAVAGVRGAFTGSKRRARTTARSDAGGKSKTGPHQRAGFVSRRTLLVAANRSTPGRKRFGPRLRRLKSDPGQCRLSVINSLHRGDSLAAG